LITAHVDVAIGGDHQQARPLVAELAGEKPQQVQRRRVGTVQIVEQDDDRLRHAAALEKSADAVEQPKARLLGGDCRGRRRRDPLAQFGDQGGDVASAGAELGGHARRIAVVEAGPQHLHPRPEGGRALVLVAAAGRHSATARRGLAADLLGGAGLADARLAGEQDEPAVSADRVVKRAA
jgi:hypothetical protein